MARIRKQNPHGNRRFQWRLQTLFWLTFAIGVLCLAAKVLLEPGARQGRGWQPSALSRPLLAGLIAFLVVRWLIRRDRP